ncbi:MAG: signal recognition particle protein [Candidatus Sumerlaeia bacterium]
MLEALGDKFERIFRKLRGESIITEKNIREALREVKLSLLEADVNYKVVKDFVDRAREKALGQEVLTALNPGQLFVKIVHDELVEALGGVQPPFALHDGRPNTILLLGLQGSGKTTFAGKLAVRFKKKGWRPLLVACDVYRPAAIEQLRIVAGRAGADFFEMGTHTPPPEIARKALAHAAARELNLIIIDTAGRLHIDETKMDELRQIKALARPDFTFLVADAMTGQDAVNSAKAFNDEVGVDGVCLTKMDGDARGGAALSIKTITGKPIKFIGVGEKLEDLEEFHAERVASRVLGMGDIVTLVEKAQEEFDEKQALEMQKKLKRNEFTLQDFLDQMRKMKKLGGLKNLIGLIPGIGKAFQDADFEEADMGRVEALILSMTPAERENPGIIDASRRRRIAAGSGCTPADVNALLRDFEQARLMMRRMMSLQDSAMAGGPPPGLPGGRPAAGSAGRGGAKHSAKKKKRKKEKKRHRR